MTLSQPMPQKHRPGSKEYNRIGLSLFCAGLTTFVSMYSLQSILPALSDYFGVTPAESALTVSLTALCLAIMIIPASILSEKFGRVRVMSVSAIISALIGIVLPFCDSMNVLLVGRALQGITLAGIPAVAMAYLSEEVHSDSLGKAMGRYVAGNGIGGLVGRLTSSFVLDYFSWRVAMLVPAVITLISTYAFIKLTPEAQFFTPKKITLSTELRHVWNHLKNPALLGTFLIGFLIMGSYVSVFNFLGYRLVAPPFNFPDSIIGLIFLVNLAGTYSSLQAGKLSDKYSRKKVLLGCLFLTSIGALITLSQNIWIIVLGMLVLTIGFFGTHSTASAGVANLAHNNRAEASALYLFSYYTGGAILGGLAGVFYQKYAWPGLVEFVLALLVIAIIIVVLASSRSAKAR